jgi:site-specific recombinase XerD
MEDFIKYIESKNHTKSTQKAYIRLVEQFLKWYRQDPINCTKKDILDYLAYLKKHTRQQNISRRSSIIALNHYFTALAQADTINRNPVAFIKMRGANKKHLHKIYTPEELDQFFDNYYLLFVRNYDSSHIPKNQRKQSELNRQRNAVILSVLINQGIRTSEINTIELTDLDLIKATIKIRNKRTADRTLPLKATQIGLFYNYLQNIRPQLLEYQTIENEKLFLLLPKCSKRTTNNDTLNYIFKPLKKHIKTIDKQFINFQQVRASVITFWIKTHGLRKAQHLAGHRNIGSTENYQQNNIDNLIDDINKLHPF